MKGAVTGELARKAAVLEDATIGSRDVGCRLLLDGAII